MGRAGAGGWGGCNIRNGGESRPPEKVTFEDLKAVRDVTTCISGEIAFQAGNTSVKALRWKERGQRSM